MPSKSMCPQCGQKTRGTAHLCDPQKVDREGRRNAVLAKVSQSKK